MSIGNVLTNGISDSDADSDIPTAAGKTDPASGWVYALKDGKFFYRPNAGFTGTDSFDYTISDGNGGADTATVTITVNPG